MQRFSDWIKKEKERNKTQLYLAYSVVLCLITQSCLTLSTPWTVAHQAPLSIGILQARILEWVAMPSSRGSSQSRD